MAAEATATASSHARLKKALSERIRLLEATYRPEDLEWTFQVRGTSGSTYEQRFQGVTYSCTCPDHTARHTFCKHLLFLVARVACQMETAAMTVQRPRTGWSATAFDACHTSWMRRLSHLVSSSSTSVAAVAASSKESKEALEESLKESKEALEDCAICFEPMVATDDLVSCERMCKKPFHRDCMDQWRTRGSATCPLCRAPFPSAKREAATVPVDDFSDVKVDLGTVPVAALAVAAAAAEEQKESPEPIVDIVISFDTTGSMYPCLAEVRRHVVNITQRLFREIPQLRLAVIAHGDYCDAPNTLTVQDFTADPATICAFVESAPATGGGDYPECYELVLQRTRELDWRPTATVKSLILMGDAPPHGPRENPTRIDWRVEAEALANRNVQVFAVQCLNRGNREAFDFYSTVSAMTNGYHMFLDQFSYIKDMIQAICFKQYHPELLEKYAADVQAANGGGMSQTMRLMFDTMLGKTSREEVAHLMHPDRFHARYRTSSSASRMSTLVSDLSHESELHPCPPSKFQVFTVDETMDIQSFCRKMGIRFQKGRGFYEFMKVEIIQAGKEIVLMDRTTGELYEGEAARALIGLHGSSTCRSKPVGLEKYRVFVQSTSVNRKLIAGQGFLYEADATA